MTSIVVNELLCYVQNNFSKHPRTQVGVAINGFFTDAEISDAKSCLYSTLESLKLDGLPRLTKRQGNNKRKMECEDILNMFSLADDVKCMLPSFVAANLQRVPSVAPGDVDVYVMAATVAALSSQLESLSKKVDSMAVPGSINKEQFETVSRGLDACESAVGQSSVVSATASLSSAVEESSPLSGVVAGSSNTLTWAQLSAKVLRQKQQTQHNASNIRLKGMANETSVKAVPRKPRQPVLQAFVGRMDMNTTSEDLQDFLKKVGLDVVTCRKLKPRNGMMFNTAAFYVACTENCRDLFYDESTWPEGCELRDWYTSR
jgi:hypothetical protein